MSRSGFEAAHSTEQVVGDGGANVDLLGRAQIAGDGRGDLGFGLVVGSGKSAGQPAGP